MKAMTRKTDAQIQSDVMNELRGDARVNVNTIGVSVQGGVVTLNGSVDTWARRFAANQAAHRVVGVLDVANDLLVRVRGVLEQTDSDIAKAARQALKWDVRIPDEKIQTTVSKGVITLDGSVNYWSQRADTEEVVRNLAGVQGVNNAISVAPSKVDPGEVRRAVTDALARRAESDAKQISIAYEGGRVTPSGSVHSWAERQAAVTAAGAISGVRDVVDHLQIGAWN